MIPGYAQIRHGIQCAHSQGMPRQKGENYYIDLIERVLGGVQVTTGTEPRSRGLKWDVTRRSWVRNGTSSPEEDVDSPDAKPPEPE